MRSIALSDDFSPGTLPPLLRDLNVVAVALLSRHGALLDANPSFLRMIPGEDPAAALLDVRDVFVRPRFDQFAARRGDPFDDSVYRGILNIGDMNAQVRSLRGAIYALGDDLLLAAEHDVAQLEKNVATLESLNEELADSRREIARLKRKLEHHQFAARGATADREALLDVLSRDNRGLRSDDLPKPIEPANEAASLSHAFLTEWTDEMSTGITVLDAEHRELIRRYNGIVNSLICGENMALFHGRFREFMDAAAKHFEHEERVMQTIGFPRYRQHKKEHDRLLNDADDFLANIGVALNLEDCPAIATYMKHWLVRHMREQDQEIKAFITG
jgi:hemerythrin-like metal-binding protein